MEEPQTTTIPARRRRTNPLVLMLIAVILAAVIGWSMYFIQVRHPADTNKRLNSDLVYNLVGLKDAKPLTLDPKFKDADGDLVADPIDDPKQAVDPPTLVFSFIGTDRPEEYQQGFKDFVAYLGEKTGKPVEYAMIRSGDQGLGALQDGRIQVAGLNTGNVPMAVNQCGFIPVYNLASEQGVSTYQMLIIVPADSPIHELHDLRGHELTLTEPGSNSGFKVPLVLLRDHRLVAGRDYSIRYSGGHEPSIEGIANKTYEAAAVASDVLTRAEAKDPPMIRKDQYRVLYTSESFPTAGFGYQWNLKPELAAKVRDAFVTFQWKGTGVEREFAGAKQSKFAPVSFKNDFALVRRIDNEIRSMPTNESAASEPATRQELPAGTPATTHEN